ncbi:hypothetical protein FQR65_LT11433 [Abscondita terminalis]|nr:hypothetical protein FQR65_LT11433 [Abscondita terminalis]
MNIRQLNSDLQKIALTELNENLTKASDDLEYFRDWLQKQKHLTARLEIFKNRDPFLPEIQRVLNAGIFYPLPHTPNAAGPRIIILNLSNADVDETPSDVVTKVFFMTMDILLNEDDNYIVAGFTLIGDYKNTPFNYFLQFTPDIIKKYIACVTVAYPGRLQQYVGLNAPGVLEAFINSIVKPLLSEKLRKRIYVFNSNTISKVKEVIDLSVLPKEFGGTNGSIQNAAETWKTKMESYRNWFLDDVNYGSNEKLRIGRSKSYNEHFGMEGTFRKLNVD